MELRFLDKSLEGVEAEIEREIEVEKGKPTLELSGEETVVT
jgi:hypothetical protein